MKQVEQECGFSVFIFSNNLRGEDIFSVLKREKLNRSKFELSLTNKTQIFNQKKRMPETS